MIELLLALRGIYVGTAAKGKPTADIASGFLFRCGGERAVLADLRAGELFGVGRGLPRLDNSKGGVNPALRAKLHRLSDAPSKNSGAGTVLRHSRVCSTRSPSNLNTVERMTREEMVNTVENVIHPKGKGFSSQELNHQLFSFCANCPDPVAALDTVIGSPRGSTADEIVAKSLAYPPRDPNSLPESRLAKSHPLRHLRPEG